MICRGVSICISSRGASTMRYFRFKRREVVMMFRFIFNVLCYVLLSIKDF